MKGKSNKFRYLPCSASLASIIHAESCIVCMYIIHLSQLGLDYKSSRREQQQQQQQAGEENNKSMTSSSIALIPKLVTGGLLNNPVKQVSCGHSYTAVITRSGQLWTWGEGSCGQLGYGRFVSKQTYPKLALASSPTTGTGD